MLRKHPLPQPGDTFERLTVLREIPRPPGTPDSYPSSNRFYECQCRCGNLTVVSDNAWTQHGIKSCGCAKRDQGYRLNEARYVHGHALRDNHTKEYRAWNHIKSRCLNPNVERYPHYGGRGITMCQAWLDSFRTFLADVGYAPAPHYSLGRLNNDGPYEPGNVAWQTPEEQANNTRHNRLITFQGITQNLNAWARQTGIKRRTLQMRLDVCRWPIERALTTPTKHRTH